MSDSRIGEYQRLAAYAALRGAQARDAGRMAEAVSWEAQQARDAATALAYIRLEDG